MNKERYFSRWLKVLLGQANEKKVWFLSEFNLLLKSSIKMLFIQTAIFSVSLLKTLLSLTVVIFVISHSSYLYLSIPGIN